MSFIVTVEGNPLSMRSPNLAHITAYSTAWALSQLNRFVGHAVRPYSVAEHSLLVLEIAGRMFGLDAHGRFAALMHDAHEAVTGDMHTPGKREIGSAWHAFESGWQHHYRTVFGLHVASRAFAAQIRQADLIALATEKRDLMPLATEPWLALEGIEPCTWVDLQAPERRSKDWEFWRDRFLDECGALEEERDDLAARQAERA